jgi:hypothetical protein
MATREEAPTIDFFPGARFQFLTIPADLHHAVTSLPREAWDDREKVNQAVRKVREKAQGCDDMNLSADDRVTKKKPPESGSFSDGSLSLFLQSIGRIAQAVLDVAGGVVRGTFRLVQLALGFHVLVAGQLAGTFLDCTFCLVGGAFHVFAIHYWTPSLQMQGNGEPVRPFL